MKIVDFREKTTEALETIRKPPIRELSKRLRPHMDLARFASVSPIGNSYPGHPSLLLQEEHYLSGTATAFQMGMNGAQRGGHWLSVLERDKRRNLCFTVDSSSQLCFWYMELPWKDCGKIPCLTLTLGQSA